MPLPSASRISPLLKKNLMPLLNTPSPAGLTASNMGWLEERFVSLGFRTEQTRRGSLKVWVPGNDGRTTRSMSAHVDTLGAIVTELKSNGRCALMPIGSWSSRMAESCRVSIHTESGKICRGTILPLQTSVHAHSREVDEQPVKWPQLEIRVDENVFSSESLLEQGIQVGDIVSVDAQPEWLDNGYIVSRFLDDLGGVACLLTAAELIAQNKLSLPTGALFVFTNSEEQGFGASMMFPEEIEELVGVDIAIVAPGQNSQERQLSVVFMDNGGLYDPQLTRHLVKLCQAHERPYCRDVFKHYFSDCAAALQAGNDLRHALIGFGTDSSHGYERTHEEGLVGVIQLILAYLGSAVTG